MSREDLLIGRFTDQPGFQEAVEAWLEYYRDTERFDVSLGCPPSRRDLGSVVPVTGEQRRRSGAYALRMASRTWLLPAMRALTGPQVLEARREALRLHDLELRAGERGT